MDTNEAKKVCGLVEPLEGTAQKVIADHIARLEDWKAQASIVFRDLQLQEVAKEIGLLLGDRIGPAILPWIKDQKAKNQALEAGIQYAIRTMGAGDGKEAVLECIDALEALVQRPAAKDPAA